MNTWKYQADFEQRFSNFSTQRRVSQHLEALKEYLRGRDPNEVFKVDILNFRDHRLKKFSAHTVRKDLTYGSSFWNWMLDREIVDHNPFKGVKLPPAPGQKQSWLKPSIISELRRQASPKIKTAVEIFAYTPLDCATVGRLTKEDFDFDNKVITVCRPKTDAPLVIPVPDALLEYIATLPSGPLYPECYSRPDPGYLISKRFRLLSIRCFGKNVRAHNMRGTYATEGLRDGIDIRTMQALMGHKDLNTTALYLTPSDSSSVRAFLGKIPAQPQPPQHIASESETSRMPQPASTDQSVGTVSPLPLLETATSASVV